MTLHILRPLRAKVLHQLGNMMKNNRTKSWFAIYLGLFVLLHSCSMLTCFQRKQAQKYALPVSTFEPAIRLAMLTATLSRYIYNRLIAELHYGAKILLTYFHCCNKGSQPFGLSWKSPANVALAELTATQIEFLDNTNLLVKERGELISSLKAVYCNTDHWQLKTSEMFETRMSLSTIISFCLSFTTQHGCLKTQFNDTICDEWHLHIKRLSTEGILSSYFLRRILQEWSRVR